MKRCPQYRRDYFDDTLSFCLEDGSALIQGLSGIHSTQPPSFDSPTMIHSTTAPDSEPPTSFLHVNANRVSNESAIAVLPFTNMSRDEDAEYLSDGLAEELLNVLSKIKGLRVAARTSAFSFKGKQVSVEEIGRSLHVRSVLEGSVRSAGKRVRISVQLVDVSDGYHLWSQTYDRTLDDIFAIQDDIAASVVEEVRSRLFDKDADPSLSRQVKVEIADAVKDRAGDPEAHRLMLLGRHLVFRQTPEDLKRAVDHFERALAIDSRSPQCWIELGTVSLHQASDGLIEPARGFGRSKECADRALSITNDFAAAHALLARILIVVEFDFTGAYEAAHMAVKSEPENPYALHACGLISRALGRYAESEKMYRRVTEIDPLNLGAYGGLGATLWFSGRLDEAESCYRKVLELSSHSISMPAFLSLVLLEQGRIEEARAEADKETTPTWKGWAKAIIENAAGRPDEARKLLDEYIQEFSDTGQIQIAEIYSKMGLPDKAFEHLELALATRDPGIGGMVSSPLFRPLYSDARYKPFLRKIGIPEEYWPKS